MSSRYVRNLTEGWAAAAGVTGGVPYHPTVNVEISPSDDIWFTLAWDSFGATKETYCDQFREDGEIRLTFFIKGGQGYDEAFQLIEATADAFFANNDPAGKLVLMVKDPPDELGNIDNPWFIVEVIVAYQCRDY